MSRNHRMMMLFLLVLGFSQPVMAAMPLSKLEPYNSVGFYTVTWGGIDVGGMAIEAFEDGDSYRMDAQIKSDGLAWVFTKHASTTYVRGIKRDGEYIPQKFETFFKLRGKLRHIVLEYDKSGKLVQEVNDPPEPEWKRPPVPMKLKSHVVDALTPFFIQRHKVYEALQNGHDRFTIRMFDGRRLTDMHYYVTGRKNMGWNMQQVPIIQFALSRTPVAGYKDKELKDIRNNQDPEVSLYLSDDGKLLPLKIVVDSSAGEFYANFKQNCDSMEACVALLD